MDTNQLDLINKLKTGLHTYNSLSNNEKSLMRETLRPSSGFTSEQVELLKNFYLVPHETYLEAFSEILPPLNLGIVIKETTTGIKVINADLLTDCLEPSDTWYSIKDYLVMCIITYLTPDMFPVVEDSITP